MKRLVATAITLYAIIMHTAFAVVLEFDGPDEGATYSRLRAANPESFQRSNPVDDSRTDRDLNYFKEINQATQDPGLNSDPIDGASNTEFDVSDYNATVNVSTGSKLNVRKGPGTTHAVVGARYRGDKLRITHHDGQWRRIAWSAGQIAYVHGNYLQNVDSDTESDPTDDPRLKAGNPELTAEPSSVPFDSSASISALSDSELQQRIDNWQGTDNDPILDRLVSERNARLDVPTPTSGKPSCENPRQCDGSESDPQSGVEEFSSTGSDPEELNPRSTNNPTSNPSPGLPGIIPGIVLPGDQLEPVESPVIKDPDYDLAHYDEGYVDISGGGFRDGKLDVLGINTRANGLFAELDPGAYGPGGVELPNAAVQIGDASNGGDSVRLDVGPEAAIPIGGADTSRNSNGDKVLEVFIPIGPGTLTLQSDDPVGAIVAPIADVFPVNGDVIDPINITNIVTGGRWDPPTERIEGLTSTLNPESD